MIDQVMGWVGGNAALVTALCALGLTTYQASMTRMHNRVSVRPHLATFTERNLGDGFLDFTVTLTNNGLGPAFIDSYEVLVDGESVTIDDPVRLLAEVSNRIEVPLYPTANYMAVLRKEYVMGKDEERKIADVKILVDLSTDVDLLEQKLRRVQIRLVYRSAYGEKFQYDSRVHTA